MNLNCWNQNRLTKTLGINYPIIQGPLSGLQSQRLTVAVSNFGGLGSFGAHSLTPHAISDVIAEIRSLTANPFAVNLWVSMEDANARSSDQAAFERSLAPLAGHLAELNAPRPVYKPYVPVRFEDQVRVLVDARVPVFSFIYGVPPQEILQECRIKRIATIGTATTAEEAMLLQEADVDAIVASGFEAGGHRGSFLRPATDSLTGTLSLVPDLLEVVEVPVIAAGGIADARGIIAVLALGAEAVQMGTVFVACAESGASDLHRRAILAGNVRTGLTKGFTGRLARGIRNRLLEDLNPIETEILPYPLQRALVRNLTVYAEAASRADLLPLWAGQSANLVRPTTVQDLLRALVDDVSQVADPITRWSSSQREKLRSSANALRSELQDTNVSTDTLVQ